MPKDEVDPEDPMELHGFEIPCADEREMVLAVVDEYARMGWTPEQLVGLFSDPRYALTHRVWRTYGEGFVRACVDAVVERWTGRRDSRV